MSTINISTLNKGAVLAALFNASFQQGMGRTHTEGRASMTEAEATELLKSQQDFDYLRGRVMKLTIEDDMYVSLYDRDNGEGAAERALAPLFAEASKKFKPAQAFTNKPRPSIALVPVTSNQVKAIGYDPETQTLAVTFTRGTGAIYHYPGVKPEQHDAFMQAESIGKHFGTHIKDLPFEKFVADPEKADTTQAA